METLIGTGRMLEDIAAECDTTLTDWERNFVDEMLRHGAPWTTGQSMKIRQIYRTRVLGLVEPR